MKKAAGSKNMTLITSGRCHSFCRLTNNSPYFCSEGDNPPLFKPFEILGSTPVSRYHNLFRKAVLKWEVLTCVHVNETVSISILNIRKLCCYFCSLFLVNGAIKKALWVTSVQHHADYWRTWLASSFVVWLPVLIIESSALILSIAVLDTNVMWLQ